MRRIGVLMNAAENPEQKANLAAFQQVLQQLGWTAGRNVQIDIRWAGGDAREIRRHVGELVALAPDVILATGTAGMAPLLQATRATYRLCSTTLPTQSALVSSRAWRGQAATPRALFNSNTACAMIDSR